MFETDKLIEVGGIGVMEEVGQYMDDSQIVLVMGVSNDRCLIFVNLNDIDCVDIINRAKASYDEKITSIIK